MSDNHHDYIFPQFRRATVQNYKTGELVTASYRISKSSWLKSEDSEVVYRVNERIAAITGRHFTLYTALPWLRTVYMCHFHLKKDVSLSVLYKGGCRSQRLPHPREFRFMHDWFGM